jgi:formylglycine-generating enzyme required for sulfatase activity
MMRALVIPGLVALVVTGAGIAWLSFTAPARMAVAQCLDTGKDTGKGGGHGGMVFVPGGDFEFGDDVYPEEGPVVRAHVEGFWMDRHEVTNAEFAAFVAATGYVTEAEKPADARKHPGLGAVMHKPGAVVFKAPASIEGREDISQWWRYTPGADWRHPGGPETDIDDRENYPVVAVTYNDARAYARWRGRALPGEAQWEWAARGGQARARADHEQPRAANTWQGVFPIIDSGDDGFQGLAPVGCFKPNRHGLYDMIGNVWEWTHDPWLPHHRGSDFDRIPSRDAASEVYTIKGGSYLCAPNYCYRYRSGSREPQEADLPASHLGFRTVLPSPPAGGEGSGVRGQRE